MGMVRKHSRKPVSKELIAGVGSLSRSAVYKKRGLYKKKKATPAKKVVDTNAFVEKIVGGKKRMIATTKAPKYYPADDVKTPLPNRKKAGTAALRSSITPGTVLILTSGKHFHGKRVVFLKQLESGLLLVTGPFHINGVPLRRVNQSYVIATSTKVDISGLKLDAKFNDAYFKKTVEKKAKGSDKFFSEGVQKSSIPAEKIADQKAVDKAILAAVAEQPNMKAYLNASFSLTKGQYP